MSKSKTKKETNQSIKAELLNSLKENDDVEEQGFNETVNNFKNSQKAIVTIRRYDKVIKTKYKKAIGYIGKQGELLKRFKNTENFFDNITQSRSTIYFKISLYTFLKENSLLKTSTLQSSYFKNNFKAIKVVCEENLIFFV